MITKDQSFKDFILELAEYIAGSDAKDATLAIITRYKLASEDASELYIELEAIYVDSTSREKELAAYNSLLIPHETQLAA